MERAGRAVALAAVEMGAGLRHQGYGPCRTRQQRRGRLRGRPPAAAEGVGVEILSSPSPAPKPLGPLGPGPRAAGVPIFALGSPHRTDLVIDALFGGGFQVGHSGCRSMDGSIQLRRFWRSTSRAVSIRPPEKSPEKAFRATETVTFHALKVGHLVGSGPDVCGVVTVADIGLEGGDPELLLTEEVDAPAPVPFADRPQVVGRVGAGGRRAPGMTGAAVLAGKAALGFGAGAVGLAVPDEAAAVAAAAAPELLHYSIDDLPERFDVLLIGPGLGVDRADFAAKLLSGMGRPGGGRCRCAGGGTRPTGRLGTPGRRHHPARRANSNG